VATKKTIRKAASTAAEREQSGRQRFKRKGKRNTTWSMARYKQWDPERNNGLRGFKRRGTQTSVKKVGTPKTAPLSEWSRGDVVFFQFLAMSRWSAQAHRPGEGGAYRGCVTKLMKERSMAQKSVKCGSVPRER